MAESKVQKVARQAARHTNVGTCTCGGDLVWAQVIQRRPRMRKVCSRCGAIAASPEA